MPSRFICIVVFLTGLAVSGSFAALLGDTSLFGADDLYLKGAVVKSFQSAPGEHILIFENGFSLELGSSHIKSSRAVVWLKTMVSQYHGESSLEYRVRVFMPGEPEIEIGTTGIELSHNKLTGRESTIVEFGLAGQVFVTADKRIAESPRKSGLYREALIATGQLKLNPANPAKAATATNPASANSAKAVAAVPAALQKRTRQRSKPRPESRLKSKPRLKPQKRNVFERVFGTGRGSGTEVSSGAVSGITGSDETVTVVPAAPVPSFHYPVNISGVGPEPVKIVKERLPDGSFAATVINRFYLWQRQNEEGGVLEFEADSAVIFYSEKKTSLSDSNSPQKLLGDSAVKGVYFSGNCVMTRGQRTIRCSQMYYDFQHRQGLAINSVMRTYSEERGIPIFLRAQKMRQICQGKFAADDMVITSSEFYKPQIELDASKAVVTDSDAVDAYGRKIGKKNGEILLRNVKFKQDGHTFFYLPVLRAPLDWPGIPLKNASFGYDSIYGMTTQTEWYMARLLGMREPKGVDSTFIFDNYSKRGEVIGTRINYDRDSYYGNLRTYLMRDSGEDRLSRDRRNIKPDNSMRGAVQFQHRSFLPYNWQLSLEAAYFSDENYQESFFRNDFLTDKDQETLVHLKRIEDNWAVAILAKWRVNNFYDQTEELPSVQYHLAGQSLFNNKFTLYSDSRVGRYRQRIGDKHSFNVSQDVFTAASSRTELDMPLNVGNSRIVPYIAGTFGYDDRSGFTSGLVDGTQSGSFGNNDVFIGEAGARASRQFWKVDRSIKSEFWDLNGIRHIVQPYASVAIFSESNNVVDRKNVANIGLLQRWQTKRGTGDKQRNVEWMRLNIDYTWVENPVSGQRRPDKYSYNSPFTPLWLRSSPEVFNDNAAFYGISQFFGPRRRAVNADYVWRISDTMAIMSDMNYDTQGGTVEQFDIGVSRYRWPNLSYYIGSRYLRSVKIGSEQGSNAFVFSATYQINPRYTLSVTHQYDFDYGRTILSRISLIRRYHRIYYGFTLSMDESLDRQTILFNIWPEGLGSMLSGTGPSLGIDTPQSRNY